MTSNTVGDWFWLGGRVGFTKQEFGRLQNMRPVVVTITRIGLSKKNYLFHSIDGWIGNVLADGNSFLCRGNLRMDGLFGVSSAPHRSIILMLLSFQRNSVTLSRSFPSGNSMVASVY